jgi:hypothetical protein
MIGDATIEVVNTLGQIIYTSSENVSLHFKKEIQLNNVAEGVYFISISSQNISFQQKIIILK